MVFCHGPAEPHKSCVIANMATTKGKKNKIELKTGLIFFFKENLTSHNRNETFQNYLGEMLCLFEGSEQLTKATSLFFISSRPWAKAGCIYRRDMHEISCKLLLPHHWGWLVPWQNSSDRDHPIRPSLWFCQAVTSMGLQAGEALITRA